MKGQEVLFSKDSDEWETPDTLFEQLDSVWNFKLDVAATSENSKCIHFIDKDTDALKRNWLLFQEDLVTCWMNPPYSMCKQFVAKANEEMLKGVTTIALLPARTDTKWFHEYIYNKKGVVVRFLKGRLKFSDSKNSAPFPSMIVEFRGFEHI